MQLLLTCNLHVPEEQFIVPQTVRAVLPYTL